MDISIHDLLLANPKCHAKIVTLLATTHIPSTTHLDVVYQTFVSEFSQQINFPSTIADNLTIYENDPPLYIRV